MKFLLKLKQFLNMQIFGCKKLYRKQDACALIAVCSHEMCSCWVIVGYSRGGRKFLNTLGACSYHRHLCLSLCLCIRLRPELLKAETKRRPYSLQYTCPVGFQLLVCFKVRLNVCQVIKRKHAYAENCTVMSFDIYHMSFDIFVYRIFKTAKWKFQSGLCLISAFRCISLLQ